jgi:hypothetical protein
MTRFVTIVVPLLLSLGTARAACTDAAAVAATRAAAEAQCPCGSMRRAIGRRSGRPHVLESLPAHLAADISADGDMSAAGATAVGC